MAEQLPEVSPRINVLTLEQIEYIHARSLEILSSVGARVDSPEAREIFVKSGCKFNSENIVKIPADLVAAAIKSAPSFVDVYNRLGQHAFRVGASPNPRTRFGVGVTNLYYQEPATDMVAPFTRKHMETCTRLGGSLEFFDFISTIGILQDISPEIGDLYSTLEMMANTTKPLVVLVSEEKCFEDVLDLLEDLFPMHRYIFRCIHTQSNLVPFYTQDGDRNVVTNHQRLSYPSG